MNKTFLQDYFFQVTKILEKEIDLKKKFFK